LNYDAIVFLSSLLEIAFTLRGMIFSTILDRWTSMCDLDQNDFCDNGIPRFS